MKVQEGDIVHVRARVQHVDSRGAGVWSMTAGDGGMLCLTSDIVKVESRPPAVGDMVRNVRGTVRGPILAISGEWAWVAENDTPYTLYLANLERA